MRNLITCMLPAVRLASVGCDYRMMDPRWKALADQGVSSTPGQYRSATFGRGMRDEGLARAISDLRRLRVRELNCHETQLTDESVDRLLLLTHLETLHATRTGFTAEGLARLAALPRLKRLYVPADQFTDEELTRVRAAMPDVSVRVSLLGSERFRVSARPTTGGSPH